MNTCFWNTYFVVKVDLNQLPILISSRSTMSGKIDFRSFFLKVDAQIEIKLNDWVHGVV
jgi:hypothetical protein